MRMLLRSVLLDVALAIVFTGLTVVAVAEGDARFSWIEAILAVLTVAPIAWRQRAPVVTVVIIVGAMTGYALLNYGDFPNGGVGMLIGMFTVAMLRPRGVAAATFLATIGVTIIAYQTGAPSMSRAAAWSQVVQVALIMAGVWALGESTRSWTLRAERLATQAERAAANERVRIARELHDIVSHHMSVISLQAGLAEYVLDSDPATARTAIATVGEASREALLDMRRLLDVLRIEPGTEPDAATDGEPDVAGGAAPADGPGYRPQPGLGQLEELVNRTRNAGVPVDVSVTGRQFPLPAGPDLCAYRVVQESLTNVLKHAGPASARVQLDYGDRALTVRIRDNGTRGGRDQHASATSHGIRGMRERAELYGGALTAEPAESGGFAVTLRLPVEGSR
jgi:signal transduction histidine kinase